MGYPFIFFSNCGYKIKHNLRVCPYVFFVFLCYHFSTFNSNVSLNRCYMTTLKIQIKAVYGTLKAYPLCEQSKLFAKIAGTSTLTMETIKHIQALGFGFDCQSATLENLQ